MRLPPLDCAAHRLTLTGLNLERFMNAARQAGIPLMRVRRIDMRTLRCSCRTADLPRVRELAHAKGWRIREERPQGLTALLSRARKRPGALVGAALALAAALTLTRFVWRVEIHGAGPYRADIAAYLAQEGVAPGLARAKVDAHALERALTYRYPRVAWFHVYARAVTLVVDVSLGAPLPDAPDDTPGDIVATRDGVVDSVRVYAGAAAVRPGELVRKGQTLIRGAERAADERLTPVRARGVVTARCWQSCTVELPTVEYLSQPTGQAAEVSRLCTPWLTLPREAPQPPFQHSDLTISRVPVGGAFAPIWRETLTWREVTLTPSPRPVGEVRAEGERAALQRLTDALYGYELIDKWTDYCMIEGDTLAVTATAEWLMDIGGPAPP